jgi:hypothetical protein
MIPEFNDDGYLPAGVHEATLEEIASRFGQETELRRAQVQSLVWLIDLAKRAGVQRIIVNGSFVTDKLEPNDVDCVLLRGAVFPLDDAADAERAARKARERSPEGGRSRADYTACNGILISPYFFIFLYNVTRLMPSESAARARL